MLKIKKVEVTPIDRNIGEIVDSTQTLDDKTKNTYSMRVIDEKINSATIDAYSKEEMDEILTDYKLNSKFYTISGQTDNSGEAYLDYPQGWDKSDTFVIGVKYKGTNSGSLSWSTSQRYCQVFLGENYIEFMMDSEFAYLNVDFQILLQQIGNG